MGELERLMQLAYRTAMQLGEKELVTDLVKCEKLLHSQACSTLQKWFRYGEITMDTIMFPETKSTPNGEINGGQD